MTIRKLCLRYKTRGAPGFTLVEMIVVMVLLTVLTGFMAIMLKETLQMERRQAQGFDKMMQDIAVADRFRADVAQAETAPDTWKDYQADLRTLILQMPGAGHVIYLWRDGNLQRRAFDGPQNSERAFATGAEEIEVAFARQATGARLVRLRLQATRNGNPVPGQALEVVAALGGDWR